MDVLLNHVSIRNFKPDSVSDEILNRLMECGVRASNTGNMQWYSVIVTTDHSILKELVPLHFNQQVARTAPVILTFCADLNRFNLWCQNRKAHPGFDNFLSFFNASIDALLVAQNVCIAAENFGLGICYLGTAVYNAAEIINVLKLPQYVVPVTSVALGWPVSTPELTDRLPLGAVVHNDLYQNYSEADINQLYSIKESLESSEKFVKENNKETLAQVFTDVRYKKADNEYFSQKFLQTLKQQGFLNE
jgi:nitroreductase